MIRSESSTSAAKRQAPTPAPRPAPVRPESAPSLREHALVVIRHAITTGDLAEDTIYSAAGLAKQLGISLSPVREAMMSLVTEGTVEAVPNRGFRLVPVTREDLEEIIRIRALLADPAVEALCSRAVEDPTSCAAALGDLRRNAEDALAAAARDDTIGFMTADRLFHEHLLEYGLGRRAAEISLRLRDQSRVFAAHSIASVVDSESAQQIVDLVGLIEAGRSDEARALVVDNLFYFKRAIDR
ncbi:GntR family transcriptional regulator [Brevibacterium sp. UCMA 11752]|uniref:GntR family transcriptional regulator n=1 Tax=Brevibacterium sp. UCMA 11752 TaxID=2745946 RepID=UPI001F237384|nr:GntR family transcriptional regulator [Brevibacterium sp. UCMA 11752]MCF2586526.1 GntR family transcriptional regulator [Brevibacterium sp. UCMA 11752]